MHIMSTNVAKTLVLKHEHDFKLRRHKDCTPQTNDHRMPLNETPSWKFSAYATAGPLSKFQPGAPRKLNPPLLYMVMAYSLSGKYRL